MSKARLASALKAEKEAWVSNLHGGSISEINLVAAVTPASILLYSVLQSRLRLFTPYTPITALIDFLLSVGTTLYATTILSSNLILLNVLLVAPALVLLIALPARPKAQWQGRVSKSSKPPPQPANSADNASAKLTKADDESNPLPIKPFITTYRGAMIAITCIAILAVDFRVFPRRLAKAENWGTSLMDLGVGSFVFSAGTVAARPILKEQLTFTSTTRPASKRLTTRLTSALRHSLPLLALGLIRLYSVKNLDYAEHVSEYGVHWNFFFTLSLLPPLATLADSLFRLLPSYSILAILLASVYEIILATTGLQGYILTAPRVDWLSKNREGLCSMAGYLSIFLAGQGVGMVVLPRYASPQSSVSGAKTSDSKVAIWKNPLLRRLALWSIAWCALFFVSIDYRFGLNRTVSRRLTNLPYVLWTAAFNTIQLLLFAVVEAVCFPGVHCAPSLSMAGTKEKEKGKGVSKEMETKRANEASSRLLRAFNRNGLAVFLVANLLTGLVNLTVPTLKVGDVAAVCVLVGYMAIVSGVALGLDAWDVSIKW